MGVRVHASCEFVDFCEPCLGLEGDEVEAPGASVNSPARSPPALPCTRPPEEPQCAPCNPELTIMCEAHRERIRAQEGADGHLEGTRQLVDSERQDERVEDMQIGEMDEHLVPVTTDFPIPPSLPFESIQTAATYCTTTGNSPTCRITFARKCAKILLQHRQPDIFLPATYANSDIFKRINKLVNNFDRIYINPNP